MIMPLGRYAFARPIGLGGSFASSAYRPQPKCSPTGHGPTCNSALKALTCHDALILNNNHIQNNPNPNRDNRWRSCRLCSCRRRQKKMGRAVLRCESFGSQFVLPECGRLEKMFRGRSEHLGMVWLLLTSLLAISWDVSILLPTVCLARNGKTNSSTSWLTGHMLFTWMMGRSWQCVWQKTMSRRISRVSTTQTCRFGGVPHWQTVTNIASIKSPVICAFLWGGVMP